MDRARCMPPCSAARVRIKGAGSRSIPQDRSTSRARPATLPPRSRSTPWAMRTSPARPSRPISPRLPGRSPFHQYRGHRLRSGQRPGARWDFRGACRRHLVTGFLQPLRGGTKDVWRRRRRCVRGPARSRELARTRSRVRTPRPQFSPGMFVIDERRTVGVHAIRRDLLDRGSPENRGPFSESARSRSPALRTLSASVSFFSSISPTNALTVLPRCAASALVFWIRSSGRFSVMLRLAVTSTYHTIV
jgi:hypothetical protein